MTERIADERGSKKDAVVPQQSPQMPKKRTQRSSDIDLAPEATALALDIGKMIETARDQVARTANAALTTLYWQIGTLIRQDVLRNQRAEYGGEIVSALGRLLEGRFGRGFGEKSLRHMLRFAEQRALRGEATSGERIL